MSRPWDNGDPALDWEGLIHPGTGVLRNRVGRPPQLPFVTPKRSAVEARVIELRETPRLLGSRTYDLGYPNRSIATFSRMFTRWAGDPGPLGWKRR